MCSHPETETDTDQMGLKPIDISHCICLGQGEHLHTIPYYLFFIGLGLCQCEHTLMYRLGANCRFEFQQNSFKTLSCRESWQNWLGGETPLRALMKIGQI